MSGRVSHVPSSNVVKDWVLLTDPATIFVLHPTSAGARIVDILLDIFISYA